MDDVLGTAKWLFNSGKAWAPDTTSHVSPFSTQTSQALKGVQDVATQGQRYADENYWRVAGQLRDGGLNSLQDQQVGALQGIARGNGLNQQQQTAYNRLDPMASGNGLNSMQQSGADFLQRIAAGGDQNGNPMLDEVIRRSSGDIANSSNLMASVNGRYGSGSHQGVTEKNIGDMSAGLRFSDYNTQQGRKDAAIRDYFGMGTTGAGQKAGAIGSQAALGTTGFGQRADAIGSLYNAGTAQRANTIAGTGQLQDAFDARLAPLTQLGRVGSAYENKNQQILDDKSRIFNETQNGMTGPVDWLAKLAAQYQGGSTTTTQANNPTMNALGGAASGYDIFGGPIGGAVGGLAGLFS
jgi:hypothetical protein